MLDERGIFCFIQQYERKILLNITHRPGDHIKNQISQFLQGFFFFLLTQIAFKA